MIVYDILIFARKNIKNALIPSFINKRIDHFFSVDVLFFKKLSSQKILNLK